MKILFYKLKRVLEYFFIAFSNRNYPLQRDKFNIFKTLVCLYLQSESSKKDTETSINVFGFIISGVNPSSLLYLFQEVFLSKEYYFKTKNERPLIIDCGSNIGMSVLFFKMIYPQAIITAIEPNPDTFKLLKKNVAQNKLKDIKLLNCCLSNKEGFEKFYIPNIENASLIASIYEERGNAEHFSVRSIRLSDLLIDIQVDLVKIDIEGAERKVFQDLVQSNVISNSNFYLLEYHHKIEGLSNILTKILDRFEEEGFEYSLKANYKRMNTFQDILIAFYRNE